MRFICLGLVLICLLTSCSQIKKEVPDAFVPPYSYQVAFNGIDGRVTFDGKELVFVTDSDCKITVNSSGGSVEYEKMTFDDKVISSSVFLPLYDVLSSLSKGDTEGLQIEENPLTVKKDNFVLYIKERK